MYEMKPEYYIGIDMIDEEHKKLFQYADEAYELLHITLQERVSMTIYILN